MNYSMMMGAGFALVQLLSLNSCGDVDSDLDGWTVSDGDCNDMDSSVHPEAIDICDDGIDSNCDRVGCEPRGVISLAQADASLTGEEANTWAGIAIAGAGDVNHDGWGDVIIGALFGSEFRGNAYVVYGPVEGPLSLSAADGRMTGEMIDDDAGISVARAGDLNGDGYGDVLVGSTEYPQGAGNGAAYVVYGPVSGEYPLGEAEGRISGALPLDSVGISVASLSRGPGKSRQVVVSARGDDTGGEDLGAILLYNTVETDETSADADIRLTGEVAGAGTGFPIAAGGDFNGDGVEDLLVAAPGAAGGPLQGKTYVIYGPVTTSMSLADADAILVAEEAGDLASRGLASAGDVNADGYDDVLVGAPKQGAGGVAYLLYGPLEGTISLAEADVRLTAESVNDLAGLSVSSAGDFNRDGYGDILVGAMYGADFKGVTYLFYGPVAGNRSLEEADATFVGEVAGDFSSETLALAGDLNQDGYPEILIGAPGHLGYTGVTYVIQGHGY